MEAAVMAASAAAAAAKEAALAASAAAEAAVNDVATAKEAVAAASASASALYAKQAAAAAATAGEAAAMRASRKRKFHLVDNDQGQPRCCEDVDLISRVPDAVLGTIISLLPTKDGVRTQAVSRRWRPLWRSAPLNLVVDSVRTKDHLLTKILSEHPGPARRFSLNLFSRNCSDKIEGWLSSQALDSLQELELTYWVKDLLPWPVFRFAPTLRVVKFYGLHFPDMTMKLSLKFPCLKHLTLDGVTISEDALHNILSRCAALESLELEDKQRTDISSQTLKFPCLKQLTLGGVTISENALQSILSGCPALESLMLKGNLGIGRLCISSQTLKSLVFSAGFDGGDIVLQELIIEDAPCLERLLTLNPLSVPATIRVISAPKLKVLGMIPEKIAQLQFGTTVFQKMIAVSLATKMHTVSVLVLGSAGPNLDTVVNFLKCFPCFSSHGWAWTMSRSMTQWTQLNALSSISKKWS
uniref:Uncharacterized protein n=1 Tax=Avena sativa TaxID=4498 RepID=A0ACD5TSR7_AVESA